MISEQQKPLIDQYLLAKNYSNIVDIIVRNTDPENDKHSITLTYMMKFLPTKNLNIATITKLAEIFDTNENAPAATLEAAYATFCEQSGIYSEESKPLTAAEIETKKIDNALKTVASLEHDEKIKTLAATMSFEEIGKNIKILKEKLQPALQTHQIDRNLLDQLSTFKEALAQKEGVKKDFTIWDKEVSLDEVETRKPVRIVEGLDLMKELQTTYLGTLASPADDTQVNQLLFLQSNSYLSKKEMTAEETDIASNPAAEKLVKNARTRITAKDPIKGDDMWWTDDKEYTFSNGSKIIQSKNDDHSTYNFLTEGDKKGMTYTLSVHRVDSHGKLLPNAYDLVQYVDGEPVAMISSTQGYSAIKNYDFIAAQIKLIKNQDFSILQASEVEKAPAKTEEKAVVVEAPAVSEDVVKTTPTPAIAAEPVIATSDKAVTEEVTAQVDPVLKPVKTKKQTASAKTETVETDTKELETTATAKPGTVKTEPTADTKTVETDTKELETTATTKPETSKTEPTADAKTVKPDIKKLETTTTAKSETAETEPTVDTKTVETDTKELETNPLAKPETVKTETMLIDKNTQTALDTIRSKLQNIDPLNTQSTLKKDETSKGRH
jgi:hypothetical protein